MLPARASARTAEAGNPNNRSKSFVSEACISSWDLLARCSLRRRTFWSLAFLEIPGFRSARIDACAQSLHQVDHVAALGRHGGLCQRHFLSFDFLLNCRLHPCLVLIGVFVGVKALRSQVIDELLRELQFGLRHRRS